MVFSVVLVADYQPCRDEIVCSGFCLFPNINQSLFG